MENSKNQQNKELTLEQIIMEESIIKNNRHSMHDSPHSKPVVVRRQPLSSDRRLSRGSPTSNNSPSQIVAPHPRSIPPPKHLNRGSPKIVTPTKLTYNPNISNYPESSDEESFRTVSSPIIPYYEGNHNNKKGNPPVMLTIVFPDNQISRLFWQPDLILRKDLEEKCISRKLKFRDCVVKDKETGDIINVDVPLGNLDHYVKEIVVVESASSKKRKQFQRLDRVTDLSQVVFRNKEAEAEAEKELEDTLKLKEKEREVKADMEMNNIFGMAIDELIVGEQKIPPFLEDAMNRILREAKEYPDNFVCMKIFPKILSEVSTLAMSKEAVEKGSLTINELPDLRTVAALIMSFFIELPKPIMTEEIYRTLLKAMEIDDRHWRACVFNSIILKLDALERELLSYMARNIQTLSQYDKNPKTAIHHLCRCFGTPILTPTIQIDMCDDFDTQSEESTSSSKSGLIKTKSSENNSMSLDSKRRHSLSKNKDSPLTVHSKSPLPSQSSATAITSKSIPRQSSEKLPKLKTDRRLPSMGPISPRNSKSLSQPKNLPTKSNTISSMLTATPPKTKREFRIINETTSLMETFVLLHDEIFEANQMKLMEVDHLTILASSSIEILVNKLIDETYDEPFFVDTFFTCCDYFITPEDLLDMLLTKMEEMDGDNLQEWQIQKRKRILLLLKLWFIHTPTNFGDIFKSSLSIFLSTHLPLSHQEDILFKNVRRNLAGVKTELIDDDIGGPTPIKHDYDRMESVLLTDSTYSVSDIVQNITLVDFYNFCRIPSREFLHNAWLQETTAPNFCAMTAQSNKFVAWVQTLILKHKDLSSRQKAIYAFLEIAHQCVRHRNFHAAYGLFNAFNSPAIGRLKVWKELPKTSQRHFDTLNHLFDMNKNYQNYRQKLYEQYPVLPILGIISKDLFALQENSTFTQDKLVNFHKFRMFYRLIKYIKKVQNMKFPFTKNEDLYNHFSSLRHLSENELWETSLITEPREQQQQE